MSKLVNVLELSLANSGNAGLSERRRSDIRQLTNPAKRAGALALHGLAVRFPAATGMVIGRSLTGSNLEYVGAGAESVVYRNGQNVIKVNQGTIHLEEAERQRLAEIKRQQHQLMRNHLADFLVEQTIGVEQHPVVNKLRAICITQPFCPLTDLDLFPAYTPVPNTDNVLAACRTYSGLAERLYDFSEASLEMFAETGLIPDTSGTANVVLSHASNSPELILIDGQPITGDLPDNQQVILGQLTGLQQVLQDAA